MKRFIIISSIILLFLSVTGCDTETKSASAEAAVQVKNSTPNEFFDSWMKAARSGDSERIWHLMNPGVRNFLARAIEVRLNRAKTDPEAAKRLREWLETDANVLEKSPEELARLFVDMKLRKANEELRAEGRQIKDVQFVEVKEDEGAFSIIAKTTYTDGSEEQGHWKSVEKLEERWYTSSHFMALSTYLPSGESEFDGISMRFY